MTQGDISVLIQKKMFQTKRVNQSVKYQNRFSGL